MLLVLQNASHHMHRIWQSYALRLYWLTPPPYQPYLNLAILYFEQISTLSIICFVELSKKSYYQKLIQWNNQTSSLSCVGCCILYLGYSTTVDL